MGKGAGGGCETVEACGKMCYLMCWNTVTLRAVLAAKMERSGLCVLAMLRTGNEPHQRAKGNEQ